MAQSKLDYVDVLRALAILGVITLHFAEVCDLTDLLPPALEHIFEQGGHGVQLFFVASAFTLFRSYAHRAPIEPHAQRNFFIRRYFRIAPMYYVGMCYYLWQNGMGPQPFLDGDFQNTPASILANVFFVNEFNPYWLWLVPGSWSVAAEMLFYLLVPLLFRWVVDLRGALRLVAVTVVIRLVAFQLLRSLTLVPDPMVREIYAYWALPTQLPVFALGILLYFLLRGDAWPRLGRWDLAGWTGLVILEVFTRGGRLFPLDLVLSVGFVLLALTLSKFDWSHLPGRVLRHIGKVSFSLYIVHWGVMHWLLRWMDLRLDPLLPRWRLALEFGWRYVLVTAISVAVATLTYKLVEEPGQRLGTRLIDRISPKKPAA